MGQHTKSLWSLFKESLTTSLMRQNVLAFAMVHSCPIITSYAWGLQDEEINGKRVFLKIQVPLGLPIIHNYLGEVGDSKQFQSFSIKKGNLWKTLPLILGFPLKERCQHSSKVLTEHLLCARPEKPIDRLLKSLKTRKPACGSFKHYPSKTQFRMD